VYTKVTFITGVRRFGVNYYIGVGFNHQAAFDTPGPHGQTCRLDFNYPCSWANVMALLGHSLSLTLMTNLYAREEAFRNLSYSPEYQGVRTANAADFLYTFVFDFNGTTTARALPRIHPGVAG